VLGNNPHSFVSMLLSTMTAEIDNESLAIWVDLRTLSNRIMDATGHLYELDGLPNELECMDEDPEESQPLTRFQLDELAQFDNRLASAGLRGSHVLRFFTRHRDPTTCLPSASPTLFDARRGVRRRTRS
jgi:hypothetical protein